MFNYAFDKRMNSLTNNIMMIRPVAFSYNEETAVNNFYQKSLNNFSRHEVNKKHVENLIILWKNLLERSKRCYL